MPEGEMIHAPIGFFLCSSRLLIDFPCAPIEDRLTGMHDTSHSYVKLGSCYIVLYLGENEPSLSMRRGWVLHESLRRSTLSSTRRL